MINVSGVKKFYCFVDAHDECGRGSVKEFVGHLPVFFGAVHESTVKVFISSRTDPIIQNEITCCSDSLYNIQLNANITREDINSVVKERLRKLSRNLMLTEQERTDLTEAFVRRSDGMFLWALLAITELEKPPGVDHTAPEDNHRDLAVWTRCFIRVHFTRSSEGVPEQSRSIPRLADYCLGCRSRKTNDPLRAPKCYCN